MRPSYREKAREQAKLDQWKELDLDFQPEESKKPKEISTKHSALLTIVIALPLNILLYFMLK